MKRIIGMAVMVGLGLGFAARPSDPFILRAVMKEKARMVMLALASNLSVAYDAKTSGLYQVWDGGMQNGNATYSHQSYGNGGATYYALGKILFAQKPGGAISSTPLTLGDDTRGGAKHAFSPANEALVQVWSAAGASGSVNLTADYRGYTVDNAKQTATLRYNLSVGGGTVHVQETPDAGGGGLQRDFAFSGIPSGTTISLQLSGSGVTGVTETWTATGSGTIQTKNGKQYLVQNADGQTRVTGTWK